MSLSTRKKMKGSFPLLSTNIPHFTVENLDKDGDKKLRGWGMVSPAGDLLCPRRQSRQSAAGGRRLEKHSVFLCRLPRTPMFSTGEPPIGYVSPSGAGKGQDTSPRAARCRSVLVKLAYSPTRTIAPNALPSRGGSVVASPPWLVPDTQNFREHTPAPGSHLPAVSSTAGPFRRRTFQVTVPQGVHPIGGPKPP